MVPFSFTFALGLSFAFPALVIGNQFVIELPSVNTHGLSPLLHTVHMHTHFHSRNLLLFCYFRNLWNINLGPTLFPGWLLPNNHYASLWLSLYLQDASEHQGVSWITLHLHRQCPKTGVSERCGLDLCWGAVSPILWDSFRHWEFGIIVNSSRNWGCILATVE